MSFTRRQIRGMIYDRGMGFGWSRTAESIATDGIVDGPAFQDTKRSERDFVGHWGYRPNLTGANRVKRMDIISTDKLTHGQEAYTDDLSDLYYELLGHLHPDELNECIRLALHDIYFETWNPVGPWVDHDFASSSVTTPHNWTTDAVTCTPTKITTGNAWSQAGQSGHRNLITTNTGSNGFVRSSDLVVTGSQPFVHGFTGRVNGAFTGSYVLYDLTNSAAIRTVTFTGREFRTVVFKDTIPATCTSIEVRLGCTDAAGVAEWDSLHGHIVGASLRQLPVPTWLTERWRILGFGPAEYGTAIETGHYVAAGRQVLPWSEGSDYATYPMLEEADQFKLQVLRKAGLGERDYWIHGLRPHSDIDELDDDDALTYAPEELLMSAVWHRVFQVMHVLNQDYQGQSEWLPLRNEAYAELQQRLGRGQPAPPDADNKPAPLANVRGV